VQGFRLLVVASVETEYNSDARVTWLSGDLGKAARNLTPRRMLSDLNAAMHRHFARGGLARGALLTQVCRVQTM
jgi:hypothetical protein